MVSKTCTKCGRTFPATLEFFHRKGEGFAAHCKECRNSTAKSSEVRKAYAVGHKEETAAYMATYRVKYKGTVRGYLRRTFSQMLARCNSPKHNRYHRYGGRGIEVRFRSFDDFYFYVVDVLQVDPRGLSVDRIDNDGNYEIGNIRFVTNLENCQNRDNTGSYAHV